MSAVNKFSACDIYLNKKKTSSKHIPPPKPEVKNVISYFESDEYKTIMDEFHAILEDRRKINIEKRKSRRAHKKPLPSLVLTDLQDNL
jgi:hypothetical protein